MNSDMPTLLRPGNINLRIPRLIVILLTTILASCGGSGGSGGGGTVPSDFSDSPLVGRWIRSCDPLIGTTSARGTLDYFPDGTFTRTSSGFFDPFCSVPGFDSTTTGTVQESDAFDLPDRGMVKNIDEITTAYTLIPRSEAAVIVFNSQATCGFSNWEVGVEFDISACTNRPGDPTSRQPTPYANYSIYLIERGQLYFGSEISFTAANRPNTLKTIPSFVSTTGAIGDEFPENLKGFWKLTDANQYLELGDQGLIRFYGQSNTGCFGFNFLTLFSLGGDRYQDPFKILTYTIFESDGNLLLTNEADAQELVYMPSDIPVDQLDLC